MFCVVSFTVHKRICENVLGLVWIFYCPRLKTSNEKQHKSDVECHFVVFFECRISISDPPNVGGLFKLIQC
ncbi:hypothetical protein PHLH6_20460 [Pseudomonas sp. Seg1]|nr:hypothetical protein PHLH6_20460 [Pseudomonas sp. Seg1]